MVISRPKVLKRISHKRVAGFLSQQDNETTGQRQSQCFVSMYTFNVPVQILL